MIASFAILVPVEFDRFDATIEFYSWLGFDVLERGASSLGNPWCRFQAPGVIFTIHTGRDGTFPYPEFRPSGHGIAFAVRVTDVERMIRRLRGFGVEPINQWTYEDGRRALSVSDPGGNVLEICNE